MLKSMPFLYERTASQCLCRIVPDGFQEALNLLYETVDNLAVNGKVSVLLLYFGEDAAFMARQASGMAEKETPFRIRTERREYPAVPRRALLSARIPDAGRRP